MMWPLIPRAHWWPCAVGGLCVFALAHFAERCITGAIMSGAL